MHWLAVYTVRFEKAVYVLHAFQKKAPSGIRTARRDVDLIAGRLNRLSGRRVTPMPRKVEQRTVQRGKTKTGVLLSGGNPQIAKADGDAAVQSFIAAMPGWKRDVGRRLDALIVRAVPDVRKAVKWNSPFYGIEGQGWFLAVHTYTHYVKVAFFRGSWLRPLPPGPSKHKDTRYVDVREDALDEAQMAKWVKQAAALPGWIP